MELPKRKHTRLKEYDYSQNGYYYVTMCTHNNDSILSDVGLTSYVRLNRFLPEFAISKRMLKGEKFGRPHFMKRLLETKRHIMKSGNT